MTNIQTKKVFKFVIWNLFGFLFLVSSVSAILSPVFAGPQSTTYELKDYSFGSGGTEGADSTTYSLFGISGDLDATSIDSTTYTLNGGLVFTLQAHTPPAPTFSNPGSNYDRLKFIVDNGSNPSDAKFAIAISDDNFVTTNYIQSDDTVGSTLGAEDWQTYANWGGATGEYVTGLLQNTAYKIKVKAQHGNFTETGYGPVAQATTSVPSLTFGVDASSVTFNNLNSGNSFTDSSKSTIVTTSTNAYNGYIVYGRTTQVLTSPSSTIVHYTSPNSAPTTWSGTGFGYTTDDSSLSGGTANRFTSGGPKYAGFINSAPGDPVADHTDAILTPVSGETFTISYRVTASSAADAGSYNSTVIYVVVPTY